MDPEIVINILISESAFEQLKSIRYGFESCVVSYDLNYLLELKELYLRKKELSECSDLCSRCSLQKITEIINTL